MFMELWYNNNIKNKGVTKCKSSLRKLSPSASEKLARTATSPLNVATWFTRESHSALLRLSSSLKVMTTESHPVSVKSKSIIKSTT